MVKRLGKKYNHELKRQKRVKNFGAGGSKICVKVMTPFILNVNVFSKYKKFLVKKRFYDANRSSSLHNSQPI